MSSHALPSDVLDRRPAPVQSPARLAVLDGDTGFLQVLGKRLDGAGWQYRVLASPVPLETIVAMRLNAIVIDLAVLGPQGWTYLEKDRKSTRLNSSHANISYAVFCLNKKTSLSTV